MDVIGITRELGRAIQEDGRYIALRAAQQRNDEDEALQGMIAEFNGMRAELNDLLRQPEQNSEKVRELDVQIKDMYAKIFDNPNMAAFSRAREELQRLVTFVNQIILGSTEGRDPDLIEYQESCGGDCGGCSGCG